METMETTYAADRFNSLIDEICRVVTKHASARFVDAGMLLMIWNRLMRMAKRFASLAKRVGDGTLGAPVRERVAPAVERVARPRVPPGDALPDHFRWLVNMVPEAEQFAAD